MHDKNKVRIFYKPANFQEAGNRARQCNGTVKSAILHRSGFAVIEGDKQTTFKVFKVDEEDSPFRSHDSRTHQKEMKDQEAHKTLFPLSIQVDSNKTLHVEFLRDEIIEDHMSEIEVIAWHLHRPEFSELELHFQTLDKRLLFEKNLVSVIKKRAKRMAKEKGLKLSHGKIAKEIHRHMKVFFRP